MIEFSGPRESSPYLSLVVPVYNGAARLPDSLARLTEFLAEQPYASELILVDDCSDEPTTSILQAYTASHENVTLLRNEVNCGKGVTVARGMLRARGRQRVFTDADLAYSPIEVTKILHDLEGGADVAIACRVLPDSRYEMSPQVFHYLYTRHVMSRVFNALVRFVLLRDVLDTQAGLKGFSARAAEVVFQRLTIPRFGFDVEALVIAQRHGFRLRQTAVHFRYDDEPTTVRFIQSALAMAVELLTIRFRRWRGAYE